MKPYCQDLRKRVVAKAQVGKQTQAEIAATFGVSLSTVEKWLHRKRATGMLTPKLPPHGPKRVLQEHASFLRAQVKQQPDITLTKLCGNISRALGIAVNASTV